MYRKQGQFTFGGLGGGSQVLELNLKGQWINLLRWYGLAVIDRMDLKVILKLFW